MPNSKPRANSLIELHKPKRASSVALVVPLKDASRECLKRLARYECPSLPPYPKSQAAAVLVGLFVGRWGDIYVLLSRRSATLSSYAGDTALPGGRWDKTDASLEDTAASFAETARFIQIGLPIDKRRVPLLCTLPPFLARSHLIVTPVVVLVTDPTLRPILNAPEVDTLFSHPLASFLHDRAPFPLPSSSPYHDMPWGPTRVRLHSFLTGREASGTKPIAGLTASILLEVAQIGYGIAPEGFEADAPGQASRRERIAWELSRAERFVEALKREGIRYDWTKEERREREKRLGRDKSRL
ncbi:hypothetical protein M408DRAFT_69090 [Serendipita vermifera MAFF 305830]|uniref:Nudix hydrolase domain-containing protein n=1 Tax=Serendipita vermifera MAFF 305830 TaxID=933852 RepID=A0A0C3BBK1_SERVB|nr:hypothetical protein M408DRAFT_69090 [Serendipita vermifera MAFF 305830]